jgi:hypothetical protein
MMFGVLHSEAGCTEYNHYEIETPNRTRSRRVSPRPNGESGRGDTNWREPNDWAAAEIREDEDGEISGWRLAGCERTARLYWRTRWLWRACARGNSMASGDLKVAGRRQRAESSRRGRGNQANGANEGKSKGPAAKTSLHTKQAGANRTCVERKPANSLAVARLRTGKLDGFR